ncbi:hypothetical protein O181_073197 [Austropuccinia psidii MF-1]|uniref:Uncharacterized protein n=1 Tax=Austropuccinia psidii MF-1 TaxID=1389203 RepID=A0A9Q3F8K3_9BASI|nr:hypothetical protein [Austropuccinia psidii MF-1]
MAPQDGPPINQPRPPLQHWGSTYSYGPGPCQWAQAIWVKIWSHVPPGIPAYGANLALGYSNNPQGPQTMDLRICNDLKDQERPKRPLITILSLMAIVMTRTQNAQDDPKWPRVIFKPNIKDNGDKNPPWIMPKFKSG